MSASKEASAAAEGSLLPTPQPAQGMSFRCKEHDQSPTLASMCRIPTPGTHVVYFPQGHAEQVAASMKKDVDAKIPNYTSLTPKLICLLHSVTLLANPDTDEVYAKMVLQPVSTIDSEALIRSDFSFKSNKPQTDFFCKTLTASDTSTHGGFSVPRRAAEKIFPPLDFSVQPPAQELVAKDLHANVWNFHHIYRGQPKRHLLTTGWSLFVSGKRLLTGDSVLFIRDEKQQLLLGIRRATRQPPNLSSSVLSSDSIHIGILGAAASAATNNSIFTVFYNPRTSPSEFVIPFAKYYKAVNSYQISLGMRFRMMFETESGTRRYIGTITGISDVDPIKWKNSQWRNIQVGWDEANTGEKCHRVSIWDIEPVTAPFYICPPPFIGSKRSRQIGMPDGDSSDMDSLFNRAMPWVHDDAFLKDSQSVPGINFAQWMNMQQNHLLNHSLQSAYTQSVPGPVLASLTEADPPQHYGSLNSEFPQRNPPLGGQRPQQQLDQLTRISTLNPWSTSHEQPQGLTQQSMNLVNQLLPPSHYMQSQNILQNQLAPRNIHAQGSIPHLPIQLQRLPTSHNLGQIIDKGNQQVYSNQNQLQLMQILQQQEQSLHFQHSIGHHVGQMASFQDQQRLVADVAHNSSISASVPQAVETPQVITASTHHCIIKLPQQQHNVNDTVHSNGYVSSSTHQLRSVQPSLTALIPELQFPTGFHSTNTNQISVNRQTELTGVPEVGQSLGSNGLPSCSASNSNENFMNAANSMKGVMLKGCMQNSEAITSSARRFSGPGVIDPASSSNLLVRCLDNNSALMTSSFDEKNNIIGLLDNTVDLNSTQSQIGYQGVPYSLTSVCQDIADVQQNFNPSYFGFQPMMDQGGACFADPRNNASFETNAGQLSMPLNHDSLLSQDRACFRKSKSPSEDMLHDFDYSKDPQMEPSSSIVSQSYGIPDMTFNSIESTLSDSSFLAKPPFAPLPQKCQRKRTYTKVYKRGAVGRSIDVSAYSGYDDLKQDLSRRFGIEGQLEDRHKVGWKLVYVDHENDVLLVGDDPWEEFISCVRSIKILSPQEVQKMSLDGDVSNSLLLKQASSSSNGGNM